MADPVVVALDRLDEARTELTEVLDEHGEVLADVRERRSNGESVSRLANGNGSGELRRRVTDRITSFMSAFARTRAVAIWAMVEEEGRTLSDIARLTGNARQVISRLYQVGRTEADKILGRATGL